ncbi:RNA polymerase sigma factor FliA [Microbacterium aoyamense]|uniref:RNA polymerase sigma factor FliA n=1 Tax=Microbacterium aoyamense TaxID=344166 RepID=A0ABN2PB32_9MICO|nr:sigma-70 family RNA polymerase sigma factor [Microbacterium aoyamense]
MSSPSASSAHLGAQSESRRTPEWLAQENLPLAKYLAVEKARVAPHVDLDDLISAAMLGLARAALSYEPERGIPFGAFARNQINWAILDEMRAADPAGERGRVKIQRIRTAGDVILARTGRAATRAELAAESGLAEDVVADALKLDEMVRTATSFEAHFDPEAGREPADLTGSIILPEHAVEESENHAMLMRLIDALPTAMQHVIRGIYIEDRTVKDLAEELEVSHPYISKLRRNGLELMREAMEEWETGDAADRGTKTRADFFGAVFGAPRRVTARSGELLAAS